MHRVSICFVFAHPLRDVAAGVQDTPDVDVIIRNQIEDQIRVAGEWP